MGKAGPTLLGYVRNVWEKKGEEKELSSGKKAAREMSTGYSQQEGDSSPGKKKKRNVSLSLLERKDPALFRGGGGTIGGHCGTKGGLGRKS